MHIAGSWILGQILGSAYLTSKGCYFDEVKMSVFDHALYGRGPFSVDQLTSDIRS